MLGTFSLPDLDIANRVTEHNITTNRLKSQRWEAPYGLFDPAKRMTSQAPNTVTKKQFKYITSASPIRFQNLEQSDM